MNRYPVWKYAIIVIALLVGAHLHPAQFLRRGAGGAGLRRQGDRQGRQHAPRPGSSRRWLRPASSPKPSRCDANSVKVRAGRPATAAARPRTRSRRRWCPTRPTRPTWSRSTCCRARPQWLSALHAAPMYLGLDLRGGVHFMLQVDMQAALDQEGRVLRRRPAHACCATRTSAHGGISRNGQAIEVRFRDTADAGGGQGRAGGPVPRSRSRWTRRKAPTTS